MKVHLPNSGQERHFCFLTLFKLDRDVLKMEILNYFALHSKSIPVSSPKNDEFYFH